MNAKTVLAVSAVVVYIACPAYRYWMLGSWIGYKILNDRPGRFRVVPKGSRQFRRMVGGRIPGRIPAED
ncbi:hypothetical protein [Gorillibacterium sp. sgz5001074]|uniref:hypothetical protein n=1 Tax=Gorillibacterium sp. sgz5001074 TaxID=3446695 RepID=UPI003F66ECBF